MKQSVKNIVKHLVSTEKITKFVLKIFFMPTISYFKNGDIVCLKHDITKRFVVESNLIFDGKILISYFSEFKGAMDTAQIEPKYLMLAPEQEKFCPFK